MNKTTALSSYGPNYYTKFAIEPAAFCIKNEVSFAEGNVIKYICRWRDKGGVDDLRKAKHYIEMLITEAMETNNGL
jgi:hypothetical protein